MRVCLSTFRVETGKQVEGDFVDVVVDVVVLVVVVVVIVVVVGVVVVAVAVVPGVEVMEEVNKWGKLVVVVAVAVREFEA